MHPAIKKAQAIAVQAVEHNWKGNLKSEVHTIPSFDGTIEHFRETVLVGTRDEEMFRVVWIDNHLSSVCYVIMGQEIELSCTKKLLRYITGWPDIIDLFKRFPDMNRPELAQKYCRLPFDWKTAEDEYMLKCLAGQQIWWYDHTQGKIHSERVMVPRKKSQVFNIRQIGHRKLFSFCTVDTGMRSILLDTLLKVE